VMITRWTAMTRILALVFTVQLTRIAFGQFTPPSQIDLLVDGFQFTEGPAVDSDGNLYFTDIPRNQIHKRTADGMISVFAEPSGHCNGLFVCGNWLVACEMDGSLKMFALQSGKQIALATGFSETRFNAPNDLVMDRTGGIYFTDPRYRAPQPLPQGKEAVYYRDADGEVTRLIDDRTAPNGVILAPDEKTLYVIPSMEKQVWAYPVDEPGNIGQGRVLCELKQAPGQQNGGGDGLTIDTEGNLYITSQVGIQVVTPQGQLLGIIPIPQQPANVTFGGPEGKTLFVTARSGLYAAVVNFTGHRFVGNSQLLQQIADESEKNEQPETGKK